MHTEEGVRPLGQSIVKQLKMDLLHQATSEVMGPLYCCGSMSFKVSESVGRKQACFPVMRSYCHDILEGNDMLGGKL